MTHDPVTVETPSSLDAVAQAMGDHHLPVVEGDRPIAIVSLGDPAIERDEDSALADISAAAPNT